MRHLLASILGGLALCVTPVLADTADNVVVVELFTSQGCSSCPPADQNLAELTQMQGVLPLSMHVDYWDYLGWRDTFAHRKHTERQFAYRDMMGARVVYTPQMIVHGVRDVPGYKPGQIQAAIAEMAAQGSDASIRIESESGMLTARIEDRGSSRPCTIWVAKYTKAATVAIKRGENAGRKITYHNVVDELMMVGPLLGGRDQNISLPQPGTGGGTAIWVQDDRTGRILAASFIEG